MTTIKMFLAILAAIVIFTAEHAIAAVNVCVQCHESMTGRLGDPVIDWKKSIHADNGIFCDGCHGGDSTDPASAMDPARGFIGVPKKEAIPEVCGKCHVGIKSDFLQSAHGRALSSGGPTCITCHGSHDIRRASIQIINEKNCSQCHSYQRAAELKNAMIGVEQTIDNLERQIRELKNRGVETENLEQRLFAGRNRYHTLFHDVDVEKVKQESTAINNELNKIPPLLQKYYDHIRNRKIAGVGAVGACLLLAVMFYALRKTYD